MAKFVRVLLCGLALLSLWPNGLRAESFVPFGSSWEYLEILDGLDGDPSLTDSDFVDTWFLPTYNTSSPIDWAGPSAAPFAYGDADADGNPNSVHINAFTPGNAAFVRPVGTFLTQPESGNRYTTYFRHTFTLDQPVDNVGFSFLTDDGAKFYLDGNEVTSFNCCEIAGVGEPAAFDEFASATGIEDGYLVGRFIDRISAGTHTLAVAVHQASAASSDVGFSLRLFDGFQRGDFIEPGDDWNYFLGFDEPSDGTLEWTEVGFDDGDWDIGSDGFGYERDGGGLEPLLGTFLDDMEGSYTSVYLRHEFSVDDPSLFDQLRMEIDYDDGFYAYVNGQMVFSSNPHPTGDATEAIPFDTNGTDIGLDHESTNASGAGGAVFAIDLKDFPNLLNPGGNNVLAIQGINRDPSSDFLMAQIGLIGLGGIGEDDVPGVDGDFNGNGQLDADDIDLLSAAVLANSNNLSFDVNGDGLVTDADRQEWVEGLSNTYFGDSNLDGQFNTGDFVLVFTAGEYEDGIAGNSTWAEGDWNGDKDFTSGDFVVAFQGQGFEAGPRGAVSAVPEPSSVLLATIGIVAMFCVRRTGNCTGA
ncbi:MAG: PEP-CTERM sorting domain-containing protein [Pirellulaceae bacterium]